MSDRRITISKILFNRPENALAQRWCELAARHGGTFAIEQEWSAAQWWNTYTIEWPEGMSIPEGVKA
jgi:hypothetical protein